MVLQIILADILLVAHIFPRPCGARKNTKQLVKYPPVLSVKASNKVYILSFAYSNWQNCSLFFLWLMRIARGNDNGASCTNISDHFPKYSEDGRRIPKVDEYFRAIFEDVSIIEK